MSFTPDTNLDYQAYLFARGKISGENLANWDAAFAQAVALSASSASTLIATTGSASAPTAGNPGMVLWIGQANASILQNRNF